ncbi:MAG TPA: zinc ribbon domain-containing protein, partial [Pyrinomonadaceae bacterium]
MQVGHSPHDGSQCPICHAAVAAGAPFCARCGARLEEPAAQELRGVLYLLSELDGWEAQALIGANEAAALRRRYELRRDELRAHLASNGEQAQGRSSSTGAASSADALAPQANTRPTDEEERTGALAASTEARTAPDARARPEQAERRAARQSTSTAARVARRPFFERLADPYTLRLLLYTGAAMLVVGVVIWLRDVLYLKLQEPLVQAELLALGTLLITICGWLTTLRTRLLLTGRALTLIGSLLVPVNFWFLTRSGLISNNGRAWMVCALCAALYAFTAFLLRASLYVYLGSAAGVATIWALVFRATPEAYGLYALTLTTASLIFLHLSRLFPLSTNQAAQAEAGGRAAGPAATRESLTAIHEGSTKTGQGAQASRLSYEIWGAPLARVALCGVTAGALLYMLLRPGPSRALSAGIFRWRAGDYDASIAMLLFAACAYSAWFTARYIYTDRR